MADVRVVDCTPWVKVLVCASPDVSQPAGVTVPFGKAARDSDGILVVGFAPGRWLLLAPGGPAADVVDRAARAERADGGRPVSILDVSHAYALVSVTGVATASMLAKVCAVDLRDRATPDGAVFRSDVAGVVVGVARADRGGEPSYLLWCDRSYGQYLWDVLLDAGAEFGTAVEGLST